MKTLWYPAADAESQNFDKLTTFHRGPLCAEGSRPKLLLHTTEGWGTSWPSYNGGSSAPHLTGQPDFETQTIRWRQHWPFDRYARALATDGRAINNGGPIQVELCGTSGWASAENPNAPYQVTPVVPTMPDWYWRELGELLAWLHVEWGVQLTLVPAGFVSWKTSARLSYDAWLAFDGLLGHQHAPANSHTDPGALNGARIIEHARAIITGEEAPVGDDPRTYQDVYNLERTLRSEGWDIYDGPSNTRSGVCRPTTHKHLPDSTHYLRVGGEWVGGAIDVGMDPPTGEPVSDWERANLDDLVRRCMSMGYRCIWGVVNHYDHAHIDYNLNGAGGGHQVVFQGPNAGFTVDHIRSTQTKLSKLGLYSGALDGLKGPLTTEAIKAFQRMRNLTEDGLPGDNTTEQLDYVVKANAGFTIKHIVWVQTSLRTLKLYTGTLDGVRETLTIAAIKRFQELHKLTADGLPGPGTTDAIKAALAAPVPEPDPEPLPAPTLDERIEPFRVYGLNAYSTAADAADWRAPAGAGAIIAARGTPDHVAAAVHAGRRVDVQVLLVPRGGALPVETKEQLRAARLTWVRVFGGPASVTSVAARDALSAAGISLPTK